ncbi:hypothetical protein BH09BAC2_BH09BAC2_10960 [soil metagenome]
MNRNILLLSMALTGSFFSYAQKAGKAFAITGQPTNTFNWSDIREIDMGSGKVTKTLFENGKTQSANINAVTKKANTESRSPMASMSAAAAYDQRHGKLFFIPMRSSNLLWLDANSNDIKFYEGPELLPAVDFRNEANNFTRMTIGADGNGYTLTNDGNHLISFSTGKKTTVTELGSLIDATNNSGISVHNKCSSWGGDIVADANGKLYLFTAPGNVFVIDIKTKVATYLNKVQNLPGSYSINGAAVDEDNNVVISCANNFDGFYKVNMTDLTSTKLLTEGQIFNASDLASGNLLNQKKAGAAVLTDVSLVTNEFISVYPNPVAGSECKVSFDKLPAGNYTITLTDLQGRLLKNQPLVISSLNHVETFKFGNSKPASGLYLLKVTDAGNKTIFADKIVIN